MKEIPLTQNKVAIVDDSDYAELVKYKWRAQRNEQKWYAVRYTRNLLGLPRVSWMHRQIVNTPSGAETDHINGDGLDNRRCNLRVCSKSQNLINAGPQRNNTSGYKGVHFHKQKGLWYAQIRANRIKFQSRYFESKDDAARAYDELAKQHFGEFAQLNFPGKS